MDIQKEVFGILPANLSPNNLEHTINQYTLCNQNGMEVKILDFGATIRSITIKNSCGEKTDCVLGFDDISGYLGNNPYFGATIGRVANRTGKGRFKLNGKEYQLTINNGENHLHGGIKGFDKKIWQAYTREAPEKALVLSYLSLDGEEWYDGDVISQVTFELSSNNELLINYQAVTTKPTPICLTNHSYFNLNGHEKAKDGLKDHTIELNSEHYTPLNENLIATGEIKSVTGTVYDLRQPTNLHDALKKFGPGSNGYDINFCVNRLSEQGLNFVGRATGSVTKLTLEVYSDQPGVQFYTSNFLPDPDRNEEGLLGKAKAKYFKHGAFCLETQNYPNAINLPNFPSPILHPGQIYKHSTILRFILDH